jgi:selenocysteine-specific elongation factor
VRTVATAGHVDHGKSTLVRALTGTDPDRFAEEKARGLTIDLGFAFTTLPSGAEVAFVDVPGHVRFLKNMLAGVGAVDVAMLVVGADDGWMPQSEEHLRILELLGVSHGVVALTKCDLVDADTLELAQLELAERLGESPSWRDAPVVVCDGLSGRGLDDLRVALDRVLASAPPPPDRDRPRLWVDRAFAARGAGTVVTGTLAGGAIATGDELVVARTSARVRVRAVESGHQSVEVVRPGARVALNLVGIEHRALARGDAFVRAGSWALGSVVDAAVAPEPGVAMGARGRALAYVGSGEHHVRFRTLDADRRFARVTFDLPVALAPGDHLILRDSGRGETLAGGTVLDVDPRGRARDAADHLGLPVAERVLATHPWLSPAELARLAGLGADEAAVLADALVADRRAARLDHWLVAVDLLAALRERARGLVAARHAEQPLAPGLELATLATALDVDPPRARLLVAGVDDLVVDREFVAAAGHAAPDAQSPAGAALLGALDVTPFAPPDDVTARADPALVRSLARSGALVDVGGIYFTERALDEVRRLVRGVLREHGTITVGDTRDLLSTSRKYAVPLLEQLDREGITRRRGDTRVPGAQA